jgi:ATP-dependent Clp protease protease subunit
MDYAGRVTVKIDGLAASAASVIAMAGGRVLMSPVSLMMIHKAATVAIGDSEEMLRAKALLDEVDESICNAYELKTSLPRARIARMMAAESWMNAHKAVELGFADEIMFLGENGARQDAQTADGFLFSRQAVTNSLLSKIRAKQREKEQDAPKANTVHIEPLFKRLSLLKPY